MPSEALAQTGLQPIQLVGLAILAVVAGIFVLIRKDRS